MTFWNTATTEQKLAQIDGGIECGLNGPQIAMNCGAPPTVLGAFAQRHGRHFPAMGWHSQGVKGQRRTVERNRCEAAKRFAKYTGNIGDAAFSIFEPANSNDDYLPEWGAF